MAVIFLFKKILMLFPLTGPECSVVISLYLKIENDLFGFCYLRGRERFTEATFLKAANMIII